ncbi:Uncharacterized protein TCAP_03046 [Tolypocladium capitatum]|uniref:Uncharacterized protein n=1 Tax=Tolypocladium capitatum TaxID=45235 RepID=A0A2K3QHJ6_9HYPO|nr:Uncharacterized protein TCAP_03046 [Tolypocladium capitatum]
MYPVDLTLTHHESPLPFGFAGHGYSGLGSLQPPSGPAAIRANAATVLRLTPQTKPTAAPKMETATVLQTVTVSGTAVTVTQGNDNNHPASRKRLLFSLSLSLGLIRRLSRLSTRRDQDIQPDGTPQEGHKTVTINLRPPQQTVTVAKCQSPSESPTPVCPSVVAVTMKPSPLSPAGASQPGSPS